MQTRMMTEGEQILDGLLRQNGMAYGFERHVFPLRVEGKGITYTPDFDLESLGKRILMEFHPVIGRGGNQFNDMFLDKMVAFRHSEFARSHHLILITDIEQTRLGYLLKNRGLTALELCDEIWFKTEEGSRRVRNAIVDDLRNQVKLNIYNSLNGLNGLIKSLAYRYGLKSIPGAGQDASATHQG